VTLIVRPDLLFDSQLQTLRDNSKYLVAYYHDSINNIPRKKDVIHFFDKVWSYEKKDVTDYGLAFTPNFMYFANAAGNVPITVDAFSVMSNDYRVKTLRNTARYFKKAGRSYDFFVADDKPHSDPDVTFITKRMSNPEVINQIKRAKIIVDIHKFGIQDGLTFRTFEAMGFGKKLVTTNQDIKTYDFYDPQNIFVIEDHDSIDIPAEFFETPYKQIPQEIYNRYTTKAWLDRVLCE
jgi:cephalosporin hydroxylase